MNSQSKDGRSFDKGSEDSDDVSMKPKLSYSREFLLSLSKLDSCKKLPSGFDESLISEVRDTLLRISDRPRIPGSLPLQGFRRNEFGASPPTRGDASYSRGNYGKWESRSSLRCDRDSDSQSDKDSDSGRRFGHQPRRSWQTPEHDGLLGSGSFLRPSGYTAGVSSPKLLANGHNQPNRSNEPYHPPRLNKAGSYSRRNTDAINGETFGSMECTSEDRAEAERRRASFEMMRKAQQKALQEKQKSSVEKHKGTAVSDLCEVLVDSKEEKGLLGKDNEFEVSGEIPTVGNVSEKPSFTSQSPASRPLIPPGFKSNTPEKSSGLKSVVPLPSPEVVKPVTGQSLVVADAYLVPSSNDGLEERLSEEIRVDDGQLPEKTHPASLVDKGENANVHVSLDVPIERSGIEDQLFQVSGHLDSHGTLGCPGIGDLNAGLLEDRAASGSDVNSASILEKILGCNLSIDDGLSNSVEHYDVKPEDNWIPNSVQSSKFAQWFFEEEAKDAGGVSSSTPNDLLSLIVNDDKATGVSDQVSVNNKDEAIPAILTCEDLEQSILAEHSANTTNMQPVVEGWTASSANSEKSSTNVDKHASLHLFSMLKRSEDQSNTTVNSVLDTNLTGKSIVSEENNIASVFNKPNGEENVKAPPNLGRTLTLETLFGTAFMKELQSVEAPVSVQRGSIESARVDPSDPHQFPCPVTIDKSGLQSANLDYSVSSNQAHRTKVSEAKNWLSFDNFPIEETSSKRVEFQLPEEDNLISICDTRDHSVSTFMPTDNSISNAGLSLNTPIDITDTLAAFRGGVKEERGMEGFESLPFPFDSYEKLEPTIYRNMQVQQSSPRFQPPQMLHGSQLLYNHLDSHPARMGSQPKFMGPDPIFNHDTRANYQISSNTNRPSFHHPSVRVAGFDVPSQHSMMHQMQMPGSHPPQFPRAFPVPHNSNQASGFIQEMNQMQGFPFGPRQPNIGNRGMPIPGNPPPDAFQRLVEMELRANSKQIHPLTPGRNPDMMHGYELDLGFRYR